MPVKFNPFTGSLDQVTGPAGSSGEIQFNGSGVLDSDSNLVWDDTNKRIGVQASTPQAPLHAASVTGATIANITSGSVSTSPAVALTNPTGSATVTAMFPASASGYTGETATSPGYFASGQSIDYYIYPVKYTSGGYYASSNVLALNYTDTSGDSHEFQVNVNWDAVSGADGYLINVYVNGSNTSNVIVGTNSWTDDATVYTDSASGWPTYYTSNESNSTPPTGASPGMNFSYFGLTSNGTTWTIEIDSYVSIAGVKYRSGSAYSTTWYDGNTSATYGLEVTWPDGSPYYLIRFSPDGGSNWYYFDTGSSMSYVYDAQSSQSQAQSDWGRTFSSFTGKPYYFRAYGYALTPLSGGYYSSTFSSWDITIPNDNQYYLVEHALSGVSGQCKVIGGDSAGSFGFGRLAYGSFVDVGIVYWTSGPTVTPQSYGYSGTYQNNSYRIYSFDGSIYSQTPYTLTTSNTGGEKYYTLSWSLPTGITQVKILKSVNGGAYSAAKSVTGSSLVDEVDQTWPATTTVTPNTVVPVTARVDSGQSSTTEPPALAIVNTYGSGNRTSMIAFGVATSSSASASYQSYIFGTSSNGNVNVVGGDLRYSANLSSWAAGTQQSFFRGWVTSQFLVFGTCPAHGQVENSVSVTGAAIGDMVIVSLPSGLNSGLTATAYVSGSGVVTIRVLNVTASGIAVNNLTWRVAVVKNL